MTKACVNCVYYTTTGLCSHHSGKQEGIVDPVTGTISAAYTIQAGVNRMRYNSSLAPAKHCGPEGHFFELRSLELAVIND